jgi:hypothetical protein
MSNRNFGVVFAISGFFAGALVSQLVELPPILKAASVAGVCTLVFVLIWALSRLF